MNVSQLLQNVRDLTKLNISQSDLSRIWKCGRGNVSYLAKNNGECFMKEVCVIGKRIKCIPLNKEYESFFIEPEEEVTIFGRILPRIRL